MEKQSGGCFGGLFVVALISVLLWFSLTMTIGSVRSMVNESKLKESGVYIYGYCEASHTKKHVNDDEHGRSSVTYTYSIDVTYSYDGQTYTKHKVSAKKQYQMGDTVELCILPENPYIVCEHFGSTGGYMFSLIIGLVFLIATVGIPIVSIKATKGRCRSGVVPSIFRIPASPGNSPQQDYTSDLRRDDYEAFNSQNRHTLDGDRGDNNDNNW